MKTSKLSGPALNWAVSVAVKHDSRCDWMLEQDGFLAWQGYERAWGNPIPDYSTDYAAGGKILDIMRPHLTATMDGGYVADTPSAMVKGPTLLVAAMRCFVLGKLGEEIELPKGLTNEEVN